MDNNILFRGKNICRMGFGCWQMAGAYDLAGRPNGYGAIDEAEAVKAVHVALSNGINFFDTAYAYGAGRSEEVLGKALRSYEHAGHIQPLVCTKFGLIPGGNDVDEDFSGENLNRNVAASLKRLQVDCLAAVLLHNPPDDFDFSKYDTAPFEKLVKEGKILAYGVSCKTQKGVANVINSGFGSVIEAVYNPLDRRYEKYLEDPKYRDRYLFISRVPLASGFFSPRTLTQEPVFPANDIRHNFNAEQTQWVAGAVRALSFLNELEGGITVSALRFQLSNNYGTVTIPGLKNRAQALDAIKAMQLGPLPAHILERIREAVPEVFYKWR